MGVALAALAVAASGTAYASASSSSENVIACIHHKGDGLYVAPKCAPNDRPVALKVAGSQDTAVAPTLRSWVRSRRATRSPMGTRAPTPCRSKRSMETFTQRHLSTSSCLADTSSDVL